MFLALAVHSLRADTQTNEALTQKIMCVVYYRRLTFKLQIQFFTVAPVHCQLERRFPPFSIPIEGNKYKVLVLYLYHVHV